jgi:hypothetical protein
LKPQHQDTLNHLEKEKKECQQALEEEWRTLKEQLQVHVWTTEILVAAKADLQTAVAHAQQAVQ